MPLRRRNIVVGCVVAFAVLGLVMSVFSFVAPVSSLYFRGRTFSRTASLGLYSNSACTNSLTSLDWGAISSGNSVDRTVYVKNLGNSYLVLSLSTINWNPSNADGMIALNWDRDGFMLAPNRVTTATLTLSVSSNASGLTTFSVDAVVYGGTWTPQYWTR
jgi:hypothetical protein